VIWWENFSTLANGVLAAHLTPGKCCHDSVLCLDDRLLQQNPAATAADQECFDNLEAADEP